MVALVSLPAGATPDELANCAALEDDTARLECYDRVARGSTGDETPRMAPTDRVPESVAADPEETTGTTLEESELESLARTMGAEVVDGWIYSESTDPLDGSASLVVMRPSDPAAGEAAQLLIGCVKVRRSRRSARDDPEGDEFQFVTRVALGWGEYLGSDAYSDVSYVVDATAPRSASLYADGQSVVASGETALKLVGELEGAGRLAVGVLPDGDSEEIGAVFDLAGIDSVLPPLGRLCGW